MDLYSRVKLKVKSLMEQVNYIYQMVLYLRGLSLKENLMVTEKKNGHLKERNIKGIG